MINNGNKFIIIFHNFVLTKKTDAIDKIYVWIGNQFKERIADEKHVDILAERFIQEDKSGRKFQPNQIIKIKQGSEDATFKSYFPKWK